jgi:putative oxidoreductase
MCGSFARHERAARSNGLQRLFSAFPNGWPGLGLLLLRVVAGVTAAAQGGSHLATVAHLTPGPCIIAGLAIASGVAVLVGFLTPLTAVALSLSIPLFWFPSPAAGLFLDKIAALFIIAAAIAIALLGPGAFSVDALIFGRREVLIPHEPSSSKS